MTQPYRATLLVPGLPRINTADRPSRWQQIRERDRWFKAVAATLWGKIPKTPLARARIRVVRHSAGPRPDFENLTHGAKYLFDALQHFDVILNDGPEFVERDYDWEEAPRGQGFVTIEIGELSRG